MTKRPTKRTPTGRLLTLMDAPVPAPAVVEVEPPTAPETPEQELVPSPWSARVPTHPGLYLHYGWRWAADRDAGLDPELRAVRVTRMWGESKVATLVYTSEVVFHARESIGLWQPVSVELPSAEEMAAALEEVP